MKLLLLFFCAAATVIAGAGEFEMLRLDGSALSSADRALFELKLIPGKTLRYRITSRSDREQYYRIRFSKSVKGRDLHVFDGLETFVPKRFPHYRKMLSESIMPLAAVWGRQRGTAIAAGAEDLHSFLHFELKRESDGVKMTLEVNAALPRRGATYQGVWHEFEFSPKYHELDALARYYALYPQRFQRNPDIDPRVYGISAAYASWRYSDPETVRFSGAGWEWCIHPGRHWGDLSGEHDALPLLDVLVENITWRNREGRLFRGLNLKNISSEELFRLRKYRLENGYLCGVVNGFYTTGLSRIHPELGKSFPDSLSSRHPMTENRDYDRVASVWAFAETSWGRELRRQIRLIAGQDDIGALAFDVNLAEEIYRGTAIGRLKNVGWDRYGAGVTRGVANSSVYEFIRSLPARYGSYRLGTISNGFRNAYNCFYADAIMMESSPWAYAPPWPRAARYAMGEKAITFWEGYSLRHFDPNINKQWTAAERDRLTNELARYAVHRALRYGVTLPSHFLCEYIHRLTPAMTACFDAGYKAVPGMVAAGPEKTTLTRYGSDQRSLIAVCNLESRKIMPEITVFPEEFRDDTVGGKAASPLLFAGFYGDTVRCVFGKDEKISCEIAPLGVNILEAVGCRRSGTGEIRTNWSCRFECAELRLHSTSFSGTVELRRAFPHHRLEGDALIRLSPGQSATVRYRNTLAGIGENAIRKMKFTDEKNHSLFTVYHAADPWSALTAERIRFFLQGIGRQTQPKFRTDLKIVPRPELEKCSVVLSFAGACPSKVPCSIISGGSNHLAFRGADREELSRLCGYLLNSLNRLNYPSYRPAPALPETDRASFANARF